MSKSGRWTFRAGVLQTLVDDQATAAASDIESIGWTRKLTLDEMASSRRVSRPTRLARGDHRTAHHAAGMANRPLSLAQHHQDASGPRAQWNCPRTLLGRARCRTQRICARLDLIDAWGQPLAWSGRQEDREPTADSQFDEYDIVSGGPGPQAPAPPTTSRSRSLQHVAAGRPWWLVAGAATT